MRTSKIRALIRLVEESGIDELEVSSWGKRVRIRRKLPSSDNNNGHDSQVVIPVPDKVFEAPATVTPPVNSAKVEAVDPPVREVAVSPKRELLEIKSPMVGTFYRAPAPDAKPFVEVGDEVRRGQVICIIEAMKLMNEIESEYAGRVVEIAVQNAQPVQFGQTLFLIEPL